MTRANYLLAVFCALLGVAIVVMLVIKRDYDKVERGED